MLNKLNFTPLTTKEIKPAGWLKTQLQIQADGLSGHLDKIWPDIRDSKWIGGNRDGWERVPYWLDGFIPLAYLLNDSGMQARAKRYIDHIIAGQQEDGWICPCGKDERNEYDVWPAFLICKVLALYEDCSGDGRIEDVLYKALKQLKKHIETATIFNWAAARWYECLIPVFWLYERGPEPWMIELAYILEAEGIDYERLYTRLEMDRLEEKRYWNYLMHVVNVAMAMKSRTLMSRLTKEDPSAFAKRFYEKLMKNHGMANWHFSGDECLSGTGPLQGTECCGVAEVMYSYGWLAAVTGEIFWGDLLERLAFNAFPATTTPDMWGHQYDQMTNQMRCTLIDEAYIPFNSNSGESHIFGLEPNFGCCTANFNQAWPKFALSTIMRAEDGVAVTAIAPVTACLEINGITVNIEIVADYPFRDAYRVVVRTAASVTFTLYLRIPSFADEADVNGKSVETGIYHPVMQEFLGESTFDVELRYGFTFEKRPSGMYALKRGPLLYSVAIDEEWIRREYIKEGLERKFPYCDYEILPRSAWAYCFADKEPILQHREMGTYPFAPKQAAVSVTARMFPIDWGEEGGICFEKPRSTKPAGEAVEVRMLPYGCTNLRMTELPGAWEE